MKFLGNVAMGSVILLAFFALVWQIGTTIVALDDSFHGTRCEARACAWSPSYRFMSWFLDKPSEED